MQDALFHFGAEGEGREEKGREPDTGKRDVSVVGDRNCRRNCSKLMAECGESLRCWRIFCESPQRVLQKLRKLILTT